MNGESDDRRKADCLRKLDELEKKVCLMLATANYCGGWGEITNKEKQEKSRNYNCVQ